MTPLGKMFKAHLSLVADGGVVDGSEDPPHPDRPLYTFTASFEGYDYEVVLAKTPAPPTEVVLVPKKVPFSQRRKLQPGEVPPRPPSLSTPTPTEEKPDVNES